MNITLWKQPDKRKHAAAGALVALVVTLALQIPLPLFEAALGAFAVTLGSASAPGVGCLAAVAAGVGKEAFDWAHNAWLTAHARPPAHAIDLWDVVATAAGGLLAALPITLVVSA